MTDIPLGMSLAGLDRGLGQRARIEWAAGLGFRTITLDLRGLTDADADARRARAAWADAGDVA